MKISFKINFEHIEWKSSIAGVRHKSVDQDNVLLRLVEYSKEMPPHWCEKGLCGYLISSEMEIEYVDTKVILFPGRSLDAKRKLYHSTIRRFGEVGIAPADRARGWLAALEPASTITKEE